MSSGPGSPATLGRALAVLASVGTGPGRLARIPHLLPEPAVSEGVVAGQPTTVVRPAERGRRARPGPAFVVLTGATPAGRSHPLVRALARGLGRAGCSVLVPDLPGLRQGIVARRGVEAAVAVARVAARASTGRPVGLVGISVGGSLALLAASDETLAPRVSIVAAVAPYASLESVLRLATTSTWRGAGQAVRHEPKPFLAVVVARSLAYALPPGQDRQILLGETLAIDDASAVPLGALRTRPRGDLSAAGRAVVALLANEDPDRFDLLYSALPAELRAAVVALSPLAHASQVRAAVELAVPPSDPYLPLAETRALVDASDDARVTVASVLGHAIPRPALHAPRDFARLLGWAARSLAAAERGAPPAAGGR